MVMLAGSGMTLGTGLVGLEQDAEERERRAQEGFRTFCTEYKLEHFHAAQNQGDFRNGADV
jgi:hypothetical protein